MKGRLEAAVEAAEQEAADLRATVVRLGERLQLLRIGIDDVLGHEGHPDDSRVAKLHAYAKAATSRAEQAEQHVAEVTQDAYRLGDDIVAITAERDRLSARLEQCKHGAAAARERADVLGAERDRLRAALVEARRYLTVHGCARHAVAAGIDAALEPQP